MLTSKRCTSSEKSLGCLSMVPFVHSSSDVLDGDVYVHRFPEALTCALAVPREQGL